MVRRWKRTLIGVAVMLTLSVITEVGMHSVHAEELAVESEYTESGHDGQEGEEAEEQEFDETEISTPGKAEMEEEQILDIIFSEAVEEKNDSSPVIQKEELSEESAEAGNATDGGFLTGRAGRRARSTVSFQECYGDQLDEGARDVYDAMKKAWGNGATDKFSVNFSTSLTFETTGTYVTNEAGERKWRWIAADGKSTDEKMQLDSAYSEVMETLRKSVQGGFDACIYDYPEIFWLKNVTFGYTILWTIRSDGSATGKISSVTISGNESWTGAKNCVSEFQTHVSDAVNSISAGFTEDMSDARKMKQIHDYICAKCVYQEGTYAHSAYGTFYNGKVVCEGYAKAFKILCNRMGLTCVLGSGTVHKTSSDGAHMWNYVMLDGGWYMVDVTWDDGNTLSNRYLFAGSESDGVYYQISEERTNYETFSTKPETAFRFVQPSMEPDMYHEYDAWKISLPVSCGSHMTGEKATVCVLCGDRKTMSYEAAEEHQYGEWKTTPATCETDGVQVRTCQNCKKTETKIVSAIGHKYGEWQIVRQATALEEGEMQRGCQNPGCISMQTRKLERLPHYVQLNTSNIILQIKQSTTGLKVTAMAEGDRIVSWKSSKPTVATVSKKGKIVAKKVGTTVITVTLASGATANAKVKVQKNAVQPVSLHITCSRLKSNRITLKKGQSATCKVTVSPFTCKIKAVFSSANPKIVKVYGNGKIKARKAGKTKITVKAGKKKRVIWITVKK